MSATDSLRAELAAEMESLVAAGTYKDERPIDGRQGARVTIDGGRSVINLCANNYLGLASHPVLVTAAQDALRRWGFGMASVRFICGTQTLHRELEERLSAFLGTEATILYSSCFDANAGLFEALLDERDAVISDALNHASIIDGVRLCKAARYRYANGNMDELEARLGDAAGARRRLIATDGVFSMDGHVADLRTICDLAERYGALVMVDDSHAVGVLGPGGRGTPALFGVADRVDLATGTLGKALGGASGGYVSGRREIVELLRQRSRPYLFSNALAPPITAAAIAGLDLIEREPELCERLAINTRHFRNRMTDLGFDVPPGDHPIVPIMIGDAARAATIARGLLDRDVYAVAFSYPVVPEGTARIRTQVSAEHTIEELDHAADAFAETAR